MKRAALVCAALAFAISGAPVGAQQTVATEPVAQPQQTSEAPPPPLASTAGPELPPPFPPMPKRAPRHRFVDVGHSSSSHSSSSHSSRRSTARANHSSGRTHHQAAKSHSRTTHATHKSSRKERDLRYCRALSHGKMMRNSKCRALMREQDRHAASKKPVSISKIRRQMRWCGKMSDREMMRHSTCRELMGDHHAATSHKTASHHSKARHQTTRHSTRTKKHPR
jgi:hypothetical protein